MFALRKKYKEEIAPKLKGELSLSNPMLVPKLEKIVISVGAGEHAKDSKIMQIPFRLLLVKRQLLPKQKSLWLDLKCVRECQWVLKLPLGEI